MRWLKAGQAGLVLIALVLLLSPFSHGQMTSGERRLCACETVRSLHLATPPLTGLDVAALQQQLVRLGLYQGKIDGVFDKSTAQAVAELQRLLGLKPSGRVDERTWEAMAYYQEKPALKNEVPEGEVSILVDIDAQTLIVYLDDVPYKLFPVAIGKADSPTPLGEWEITEKIAGWHGATGVRWMRLSTPWGSYGIHGTNNPASIGQMASAGCVRMFNHDVIEVYDWVQIGTKVTIKGRGVHGPVRVAIEQGAVGQDVVFLQWRLRELGFDPGQADGVCGGDTVKALTCWQHYRGLPTSGRTDRDQLYLLGLW